MKKFILFSLSLVTISSLYCMDENLKNEAQVVLTKINDLSKKELHEVLAQQQPIDSLVQLEKTVADLANKIGVICQKLRFIPSQESFDWDNAKIVETSKAYATHCAKMIAQFRSYLLATNDPERFVARAIGLCNNTLFIDYNNEDDVAFGDILVNTERSLDACRPNDPVNKMTIQYLTLLAEGKLPDCDLQLESMKDTWPDVYKRRTERIRKNREQKRQNLIDAQKKEIQ